MDELTPKIIETFRDAARRLRGADRRAFEAQVSLDYLGGDARLTETVFGFRLVSTYCRQGPQGTRVGPSHS